jgi:hypothetical protein
MTLGELRKLVARLPHDKDNLEVKVWLPGSYITLSGSFLQDTRTTKRLILIEGNLDPGSALE